MKVIPVLMVAVAFICQQTESEMTKNFCTIWQKLNQQHDTYRTTAQEQLADVTCRLESQRFEIENQHLLEELNNTLHDVTKLKITLEETNQRQMDQIVILQNQTAVADMTSKLESQSCQIENQHLLEELNGLNKTLQDVTRLNIALEETNRRQMDQILFQQNQTADVKESRDSILNEINKLTAENQKLVESMSDVKESRDSIQNEIKKLMAENQKLLKEVQQLRNESMSDNKLQETREKETWQQMSLSIQNLQETIICEIINKVHPADCAAICKGTKQSHIYSINIGGTPSGKKMQVRCDMNHGGGWTVIQQRFDGSVNFQQNWDTYKNGFGTPDGEYWLGNDNIHLLTSSKTYQLLVELTAHDGTKATAKYENFTVAGESDNYRMTLGAFIGGTAGDSLSHHNGVQFSTYDKDNDKWSGSCSDINGGRGGWWYKYCDRANVNGGVYHTSPIDDDDSIEWQAWRGGQALKGSIMAIRPKNF